MEFMRTVGQGIHHLSFDRIDDHDEIIKGFTGLGYEIEASGSLGGATGFTYIATQSDLGTVFEAVKVDPSKESTIVPYGTYPQAT